MVEVPGIGGQAPVDRVYNRVLNDVHTARHAGGEEPLCPARHSIGFLQEASGEKSMVRSHLPVHNVLCENMGANRYKIIQPCQLHSYWAPLKNAITFLKSSLKQRSDAQLYSETVITCCNHSFCSHWPLRGVSDGRQNTFQSLFI